MGVARASMAHRTAVPSIPAPMAHGPEPSPPDATRIAAPIVVMHGVAKSYGTGTAGDGPGGTETAVHALRDVDVTIDEGEFVAILGPSGSGKSTLMNLIGCLDVPDAGSYLLAGRDVAGLDDDSLARVRNRFVGFVFQSWHLLPRTSALDNVALPLAYRGDRDRRAKAERALATVGLADRLRHRPNQLSGGQQQRVAIARALVTEPALILADEPTGSLDSATGGDVLRLLAQLNEQGRTVIVVTHDESVAEHARRVIRLRDGRIDEDRRLPTRAAAASEPADAVH